MNALFEQHWQHYEESQSVDHNRDFAQAYLMNNPFQSFEFHQTCKIQMITVSVQSLAKNRQEKQNSKYQINILIVEIYIFSQNICQNYSNLLLRKGIFMVG